MQRERIAERWRSVEGTRRKLNRFAGGAGRRAAGSRAVGVVVPRVRERAARARAIASRKWRPTLAVHDVKRSKPPAARSLWPHQHPPRVSHKPGSAPISCDHLTGDGPARRGLVEKPTVYVTFLSQASPNRARCCRRMASGCGLPTTPRICATASPNAYVAKGRRREVIWRVLHGGGALARRA